MSHVRTSYVHQYSTRQTNTVCLWIIDLSFLNPISFHLLNLPVSHCAVLCVVWPVRLARSVAGQTILILDAAHRPRCAIRKLAVATRRRHLKHHGKCIYLSLSLLLSSVHLAPHPSYSALRVFHCLCVRRFVAMARHHCLCVRIKST